jgi:photosystem II stability/assembly factor-like uncharacterized protein
MEWTAAAQCGALLGIAAAMAMAAAMPGTVAAGSAERGPGAPFEAARLDAWKVIGAGGGGAQFHPAISPLDEKWIFVNSDMTDAFVSRDGGESWRMFNLRGVVQFFAFDPVSRDVAYAKTIGLWRTTDGGKTWGLVQPDPANVKRIVTSGDHAQQEIETKDGIREEIAAFTVDPGDSRTLYAAMASGDATVFCASTDWGRTWTKGERLPAGGRKIFVDPKSPAADRTIYVIGSSGVSVREGGKWTHNKGPEGVRSFNDSSAGFAAGGGRPIIYGVAGRAWRGDEASVLGVFVTTDCGATWRKCDGGIAAQVPQGEGGWQFQAVAACPTEPKVAYVSYKGPRVSASGRGRYMGVAKTVDAGETWELVWLDAEGPAENVKDAWLNERFGPEWGENPFNLAVPSGNADLCVGTDFGRTMRTTDGGKSWEGVYSKRVPGGEWSTTGLDVSCCYSVHFDPFDAKHIFISYTDIGLMESVDGGTSWASATADGVPREWLNATYWVEFDPEVKGRVWAVMSGVHDLPRAKMWRRGDGVGGYSGGVCVSDDGGKTWRVSDAGINGSATTHIVLDPASPAEKRTLWVCGLGKGVFKSTDDGKTWALANEGIEGKEPLAWRLTRADDGMLYLVVARRSEDGRIGDADDGALYRSTDGAGHWEKMTLPAGTNGPTSIEVDPADGKRLCLSAWGVAKDAGDDTGGGIFVSADGGKTWKCTLQKDQHIHDVTIDRRNGAYYACGFESNAWRSTDRGETWERIKGYNFKWGRRVVPDPNDERMVYITTFGGSVWYGPAAGDAKAVEDIVTPAMKY